MNYILFLLLICLVLCKVWTKSSKKIFKAPNRLRSYRKFSFRTCKICVDLAAESQYDLSDATKNVSIANECLDICNYVEVNTNKIEVITACNLLCDMVGINEFRKAIIKANMDSIYFCQLLKVCGSNENGDALITSLIFKPNKVKFGSVFNADIYYISLNGTGSGELAMSIKTPDNKKIYYSYLIQSHYPGVYEEVLDLEAKSDPQCNHTINSDCVQWSPGIYNAEISKIFFIK